MLLVGNQSSEAGIFGLPPPLKISGVEGLAVFFTSQGETVPSQLLKKTKGGRSQMVLTQDQQRCGKKVRVSQGSGYLYGPPKKCSNTSLYPLLNPAYSEDGKLKLTSSLESLRDM